MRKNSKIERGRKKKQEKKARQERGRKDSRKKKKKLREKKKYNAHTYMYTVPSIFFFFSISPYSQRRREDTLCYPPFFFHTLTPFLWIYHSHYFISFQPERISAFFYFPLSFLRSIISSALD